MKSIKSAARIHGRKSGLLLLSLFILTAWGDGVAHADGVTGTIKNGQTVTGTVTGKGFDTYTFKVTAGSSFFANVSETGTHDETFIPNITLSAPGSAIGRFRGQPLYTILKQNNAAVGTWSVKVDRKDLGTTGGSYALTRIQLPGIVPLSSNIAGGALSPGAASSGTNSRGKIDVWTFNGVAGQRP